MSMNAQVGFDARALTDQVDPRTAKAFVQSRVPRRSANVGTTIVVVIVCMMAFGVFATVIPTLIVGVATSAQGESGFLTFFPAIVLCGFIAIISIVVVALVRGRGSRNVRMYRLSRFAQANGMQYFPMISNPKLPGMIFGLGDARQTDDAIRGVQPRFVEFGNYRFSTGSGKERATHRWGYLAVKLNTPLPHIVLDAIGNNSFLGSNLPVSFDRRQRLSLEGDFDRHFALYCPAGYERDALYLFTPDVMARFIDNAAQLDVEIVDDWMFLYMRRQVVTTDPAAWAWLFSIVHALLGKLDQWERWRDDRLSAEASAAPQAAGQLGDAAGAPAGVPGAPTMLTPPPGVAMEGRRLKRRFVWLPIVLLIAYGAFQIVRIIADFR